MKKVIYSTLAILFFQLLGNTSSYADLPPECHFAKNWSKCETEWEKIGLTTSRLNLVMDLSADAYLPYDQVQYGQEPDMTQPLKIDGQINRRSQHKYSSKIPNMPSNTKVFNGVTGSYGQRYTSPLGFVYYEPSALEKIVIANPELAKTVGLNALARIHSTHRTIAISFRGTRHMYYDLLLTDASARKMLAPDETGHGKDQGLLGALFNRNSGAPKVHGGFLATFESGFPEIQTHLKHFLYERLANLPGDIDTETFGKLQADTEVIITGHSLGGALAQIAGSVIAQRPDLSPNKPKVYTFSQPKAGNAHFINHVESLGVTVFRIYRENDIVPMVPGFLPGMQTYEHGGEALELEDFSHADNLWQVSKVMPRHSIHSLNKGVRSFFGSISDGVDNMIDSLADGFDEIFGDESDEYYDDDLYYDYEYNDHEYDEYGRYYESSDAESTESSGWWSSIKNFFWS